MTEDLVMAEKERRQEHKAAGHTASVFGKQEETDERECSAHAFLLFILVLLPTEYCCLHAGQSCHVR